MRVVICCFLRPPSRAPSRRRWTFPASGARAITRIRNTGSRGPSYTGGNEPIAKVGRRFGGNAPEFRAADHGRSRRLALERVPTHSSPRCFPIPRRPIGPVVRGFQPTGVGGPERAALKEDADWGNTATEQADTREVWTARASRAVLCSAL